MTTETSGRGGEDADANGHGEDEDEAVGKDGECGKWGWDMGRPYSLGEVHRRHDGVPSLSGEGR